MRTTSRLILLVLTGLLILLVAGLVAAQGDLPPDEDEPATPTPAPQVLPDLPLTADFTYIIETGDNLELISALFDVSLDCVLATNDLDRNDIIRPGDELLISIACPAYDGFQDVTFPRPDAPGLDGSDGTYVVRLGDTLDTIAQAFDVSLVSLQQANGGITAADLVPGLVLTLPTDGVPYGAFPATDDGEGGGQGGGAIGGGLLDGESYVVQPGDTLDTIAQAFDISLITLRIVNDLEDTDTIFPGRVLFIPDNAAAYGQVPPLDFGPSGGDDDADTSPSGASETDPDASDDGQGGGAFGGGLLDGESYVVQPGDTLDTIAQAFDISLVSLRIANDLEDTDTIFPGRVLVIPDGAPAYGEFPATDFGASAAEGDDEGMGGGAIGGGTLDGESYVVQPGDTLDTIAQAFDISLVSLRIANDLEDTDTIFPGRVLVIPDGAPAYGTFPATDFGASAAEGEDEGMGGGAIGGGTLDGETYVVQPNDTLDTIAQAYNVSLVSLRIANDLEDTDTIFPGRVLVIPDGAPAYGQVPALETGDGAGGGAEVYIVQFGDVLVDVAEQFNVQTACLLERNGITNSRLVQPGTQIVIPVDCPPFNLFPQATPVPEAGGEGDDGDLPPDESAG